MIMANWGSSMMEMIQAYFYSDDFKHLLMAIGIFLLFLLLRKIFTTYIYKILLRIFRKTPTELFTQILLAYERPVQWLFIVIGTYVAIGYFPYIEQSNPLFIKVIQSSIIVLISWGLFNLSSATSILFENLKKRTQLALDDILIPFISKSIRVIIVAISITVILEVFDYSISGFIAGLGLGGLAFALAAQDALSNLFGGFVILTERPFTIGDWILTPSVEGTVEDITFRSTKIRTFAQAVVTVPNSTLANEPITNWSRMGKRRVSTNICLSYDTPVDKLKSVVRQINDLLKNHPEIHQETIFVTFDEYKKDGSDIMLYYFTKTTVWGEYLSVKEDINFKIMQILENEGVSIAIPSRRLYVNNETAKSMNQQQIEEG